MSNISKYIAEAFDESRDLIPNKIKPRYCWYIEDLTSSSYDTNTYLSPIFVKDRSLRLKDLGFNVASRHTRSADPIIFLNEQDAIDFINYITTNDPKYASIKLKPVKRTGGKVLIKINTKTSIPLYTTIDIIDKNSFVPQVILDRSQDDVVVPYEQRRKDLKQQKVHIYNENLIKALSRLGYVETILDFTVELDYKDRINVAFRRSKDVGFTLCYLDYYDNTNTIANIVKYHDVLDIRYDIIHELAKNFKVDKDFYHGKSVKFIPLTMYPTKFSGNYNLFIEVTGLEKLKLSLDDSEEELYIKLKDYLDTIINVLDNYLKTVNNTEEFV